MKDCFWCGGYPVEKVYEPCGGCRAKFEDGVLLMEAQLDEPWVEGQPHMETQDGHEIYPSGHYVVVNDDAVKQIFTVPDAIIENKKAFVDTEAWKTLTFVEGKDAKV